MMGEMGLLGDLAFWAGFSAGVALTASVAVLIARRVRKSKKGEINKVEGVGRGNGSRHNDQDELLKRRVAETIKQVESDIPEPLRPYLAYRGPVPDPLKVNWFPRELTIEAPGQEPRRVEICKDSYGYLYARIDKAK